MAPTVFFYVEVLKNDRQNKIASQNQRWQKKIQFVDRRLCSSILCHYNEAMAYKQGVNLFGGWSWKNLYLNPIELLWSQMKQLYKKDCLMPAAGLKKRWSKNLRKILPIFLKSLHRSMPRRMKAVVTAQGGHVSYQIYSRMIFYIIYWTNQLILILCLYFWAR